MTKFQWEKARRKSPGVYISAVDDEKRQAAMHEFVTKRGISCFKCGRANARWAKTGIDKQRRAWAICVTCVRNKRRES